MTETKYLSCAETAKLIRTALKSAFPGIKFSVKSKTYSMGASISIHWTDGPCGIAVDAIAGQFSGASFDGSIDLKTSHTSWLSPDGTAIVAHDPGTVGSMGDRQPERNWMPHPDAIQVRFGADYVFTTRRHSVGLLTRVRDRLAAKGYPAEMVLIKTSDYDGSGYFQIEASRADTRGFDYFQIEGNRADTRGFDMEREMNVAVSRTHIVKASS